MKPKIENLELSTIIQDIETGLYKETDNTVNEKKLIELDLTYGNVDLVLQGKAQRVYNDSEQTGWYVEITEAWFQFADFEAPLKPEYVSKIEKHFNK